MSIAGPVRPLKNSTWMRVTNKMTPHQKAHLLFHEASDCRDEISLGNQELSHTAENLTNHCSQLLTVRINVHQQPQFPRQNCLQLQLYYPLQQICLLLVHRLSIKSSHKITFQDKDSFYSFKEACYQEEDGGGTGLKNLCDRIHFPEKDLGLVQLEVDDPLQEVNGLLERLQFPLHCVGDHLKKVESVLQLGVDLVLEVVEEVEGGVGAGHLGLHQAGHRPEHSHHLLFAFRAQSFPRPCFLLVPGLLIGALLRPVCVLLE